MLSEKVGVQLLAVSFCLSGCDQTSQDEANVSVADFTIYTCWYDVVLQTQERLCWCGRVFSGTCEKKISIHILDIYMTSKAVLFTDMMIQLWLCVAVHPPFQCSGFIVMNQE